MNIYVIDTNSVDVKYIFEPVDDSWATKADEESRNFDRSKSWRLCELVKNLNTLGKILEARELNEDIIEEEKDVEESLAKPVVQQVLLASTLSRLTDWCGCGKADNWRMTRSLC